MTDEDRVSKLEKIVRNFNLITAGIDQLEGGFPKLNKFSSLEERLDHLEALHENFKITGGDNCNIEGNLQNGFTINVLCPDSGVSGP